MTQTSWAACHSATRTATACHSTITTTQESASASWTVSAPGRWPCQRRLMTASTTHPINARIFYAVSLNHYAWEGTEQAPAIKPDSVSSSHNNSHWVDTFIIGYNYSTSSPHPRLLHLITNNISLIFRCLLLPIAVQNDINCFTLCDYYISQLYFGRLLWAK